MPPLIITFFSPYFQSGHWEPEFDLSRIFFITSLHCIAFINQRFGNSYWLIKVKLICLRYLSKAVIWRQYKSITIIPGYLTSVLFTVAVVIQSLVLMETLIVTFVTTTQYTGETFLLSARTFLISYLSKHLPVKTFSRIGFKKTKECRCCCWKLGDVKTLRVATQACKVITFCTLTKPQNRCSQFSFVQHSRLKSSSTIIGQQENEHNRQ